MVSGFFFFKQKTAYEMRISDWSSDVCSSDLDITEAITLADTVIVLSQRPTRVLAAVPITLERPRNVFEPFRMAGYEAIYDRIWSIFRSELPDLRPASIGGAA